MWKGKLGRGNLAPLSGFFWQKLPTGSAWCSWWCHAWDAHSSAPAWGGWPLLSPLVGRLLILTLVVGCSPACTCKTQSPMLALSAVNVVQSPLFQILKLVQNSGGRRGSWWPFPPKPQHLVDQLLHVAFGEQNNS